jgi:Spy/CpxP family protein refolding chaperone
MSRQTGFSIALAVFALVSTVAGAAEAHSRGGGHHGGHYDGHHGQRWQCFDKYPKPV